MHRIFPPHPGLHCEHRQNRQGRQPDSRVAQRRPGQNSQPHECSHRQCETSHINPGAQGRIRTFVPRKEGQIYSLLALTTHPPVQTSGPSRPQTVTPKPATAFALCAEDGATAGNDPNRRTECARKSSRTQTPHLEKFLMECCWEKSVTPPRRAKCPGFRNRSRFSNADHSNAGAGEGI